MPGLERNQQIDSFMAAIRMQESGTYEGNYIAQGMMQDGDRAIGAYGIMSQNWQAYAASAGIAGANWRDPAAQDIVARAKMQADFKRYGSWSLVAVAWYAGNVAADRVVEMSGGKVTDSHIRKALGDNIADYAQQASDKGTNISQSEWGMENGTPDLMPEVALTTPGMRSDRPQESSGAAADMVRSRLQQLANVPSPQMNAPVEEPQVDAPVEEEVV